MTCVCVYLLISMEAILSNFNPIAKHELQEIKDTEVGDLFNLYDTRLKS